MFDADAAHKTVTAHDVVVLENDADAEVIELGVEDVDNYIVSASNTIVHNAPCFIAGTRVSMGDGTMKNIEDVKMGEYVATWDFEKDEFSNEQVLEVTETENEQVYHLNVKAFGNEITVFATPDHPFYVKSKGWACKDPDLLKKKSGMDAVKIEVGDQIFTGKEGEMGDNDAHVVGIEDSDPNWRPTV